MSTDTVPPPSPEPLAGSELTASLTRPLRAIDVVMVDGRRFAATISDRARIPLLIAVLAVVSLLFTVPYAAVGASELWAIAALYVGSMLICFPSLHVFGRYAGLRVTFAQHLALALSVTAVAACFTLAFAPILWFLRATMGEAGTITPESISIALLTVSLAAGLVRIVVHLREARHRSVGVSLPLLVGWQLLFAFICFRMAEVLGLLG